jgi:fatty acid desaturase
MRAANPIDVAIRTIPSAWFTPDRRIYWADMLLSATLGWSALAFAVVTTGWTRAALLIVAAMALYRAVLFTHEITHLAPRDVPGFRAAWNALVGVPLLVPAFLYEGVHVDHHRPKVYGTNRDPEYVPFGRRSPLVMMSYVVASALVPIGLSLRFGVLAPLSWVLPPLRRLVTARMSALVINHEYVRRAPFTPGAIFEEAGACALIWAAAILTILHILPLRAIAAWFIVASASSTINAVRTLAAHRYDHDDETELTMVAQLLDTCTIARLEVAGTTAGRIEAVWRALWSPVGLRYHALHHWIPSLPYHSLGRAHRLLARTLANDSPYAATSEPDIVTAVKGLVRRAIRSHG